MQGIVEFRGLPNDNQLGSVRMVQGEKKQALLNLAINEEHSNPL